MSVLQGGHYGGGVVFDLILVMSQIIIFFNLQFPDMLNNIIQFSIGNKLIVGFFILGLIGYGSYELTQLPIDAVPDFTDNQVLVITTSPALGAPDAERLITFPVEHANSNIPGLKEIRSFSRFGLSLVTIVFEDDVDVYWTRQQVTERLGQVQSQIPQGLKIPLSELASVSVI